MTLTLTFDAGGPIDQMVEDGQMDLHEMPCVYCQVPTVVAYPRRYAHEFVTMQPVLMPCCDPCAEQYEPF